MKRRLPLSVAMCSLILVLSGGVSTTSALGTYCSYDNVDLLEVFNDRTAACHDLNVSNAYSKHGSGQYYWAQYLDGFLWRTGCVGRVFLWNGSYRPWEVLIRDVAQTTPERMRGNHGAFVGVYT